MGRLKSGWMVALASALGWVLASRAGAQLLRAPYLQSLTPTSVVIMWQTDLSVGVDSVVHYGTTLGALGLSEVAVATASPTDAGLRNHTVTISGLMPGTKYYYDVGTSSGGVDAGGTANHFFVTAPTRGSVLPFDVWVVGDSGTNNAQQLAVYTAMLGAGGDPELFLHVGDLAYNTGTHAQFTSRVFALYADVLRHTPLYPALGNHEASEGVSDSTTQSGPYFEAFTVPSGAQAGGVVSGTEAYYALDYANAHFIALDSDDSSTSPGSAQLQWLAADLAAVAPTQQWIIVWFHHPPYSKGSHDSDFAADSGGRMTRMREHVVPMLEAAGVDLVLAGHSHSYERSYLIAGAYGYGTGPDYATPGFSKLIADGHVLEQGDGRPAGSGPYRKPAGRVPFGGTLYVVSGHGGNSLGGTIDHPVMRFSELRHGSLLLRVDGTDLRVRNVRSDGVVSDDVRLHKPALGCSHAAECDDLRACTSDTCAAGRCQSTALGCPQGQACSEAAGHCVCVPSACDDGNACTQDSCDAVTGCMHATLGCDDHSACTSDSCLPASGCQHQPFSCDDGDACTADSCSPASGCAHTALDCNDGSACTTDSCSAASGCTHMAIRCDDADACTADSCAPASGCAHAAVRCDDADACTIDGCAPASGCAYTAIGCDDGDGCTQDSCERASGCVHARTCSDPTPVDASTRDAQAPQDAAFPADAAAHDAAAHDAAAHDAATSGDASTPVNDASAARDASASADASAATGGNDASQGSTGLPSNRRDASTPRDGATAGADAGRAPPAAAEGCGCRLSGAPASTERDHERPGTAPWWLAVLVACWLRARRRREA